jgi:hypothetical protein
VSADKPLVYLILGAAGSGRRDIVADVIDGGMDKDASPVVFVTEDEIETTPDGLNSVTWKWNDAGEIDANWPVGVPVGFFIADGRGNPVDQIEAFKPWMVSQGVELARVVCVIHCDLIAAQPPLMVWHDACIHFSDITLLNRRDNVENKWLSDYQSRFAKRHIPCLVEMMKKGRVKNPGLVLDQQTRRLSHWFDEAESDDWKTLVAAMDDVIIEDEAADDPDDETTEEEDEYLARHPGGDRKKVIPNIADYLD